MTNPKNLLKKLNTTGATALLLVSSLLPTTQILPAHKVAAQTKEAVAQTIDSVSQTPDYGTLSGDGTTAAQDFKAQVISDTFGSGTLSSVAGNFVSNQAPSGTGMAIGLVPVVPTISNTGAAVLTSNDNAYAIGGVSNSLLTGNYTSAKNGASGGATVTLNGAVDWTKDFSFKYNIQGQGADGSKGSGFGVAFVPLSPETFETYLDGNAVPFAAGGSVYPTLAAPNLNSLFTNSIAAAIPNSFYFGEKGNATGNIGFHYADMTSFGTGSYKPTDAGFTSKTNYNFFDPTNPGKGFAWGTGTSSGLASSGTAPSASGDAVQSGFAWSATPTASTVPEVFNVDYQMTYTASSRTLTVTPYVAGTSTPISMTGTGMTAYGAYSGFATPSYTTKIAGKLVGQTYSIAGLRMWNGITGVGTATGAPSYAGQPQTTQMTFLGYNFASATANVTVNYQDTTGATIKPSTTIGANVFATLGVTGISQDAANDTWTWEPASIAGYTIQSANDVEVSSTAANNQLTLVYAKSADPATTNWSFQYDSSAQNPPALPATITQSGVLGDSITTPSMTLPAGYVISSVLGADGLTYRSVSAALSAYPTMTQAVNDFVVTLTPSEQTANFIFSFDSSHANDPAQPTLPSTISENGLTGSPITDLSA